MGWETWRLGLAGVWGGREKEITYRKPYVTIGVGKKEEEMLLGRWIFFLVLCPILPFLLLLLGFDRGSEWEGENINGFFPYFFSGERRSLWILFNNLNMSWDISFFVLLLRFLLLLCRSSLRALVGGDDDVSVSAEWLETFFCCSSHISIFPPEREVRRLSEISCTNWNHHRILAALCYAFDGK